jgi:hypothetical protein
MPGLSLQNTLPCRHQFDVQMASRLRDLLLHLAEAHPDVLEAESIDPAQYPLLLNSAIQSIRGTVSAASSDKKRFIEAILYHMQSERQVTRWEFEGSAGRNDYRIELPRGRLVAVEMKGCPDGNNMTIWERPSWADEFVIWSQCPESLSPQPGRGVWSGISTRLIPKMIVEQSQVDALVFFDGRCGSAIRRCPKPFGVQGPLRRAATDIEGHKTPTHTPPPCIFLFPRTLPHVRSNRTPPTHDLATCRFAAALLAAFGVPKADANGQVHWVKLELTLDESGEYRRTSVGTGLDNDSPTVAGAWEKIKREYRR